MHKITPHLWFDKEAKEAATFYTSLFDSSRITNVSTISGTPSGDTEIVSFELSGQPFMAISAGPYFTFNPSISFSVMLKTKEGVDALWEKLSSGGTVLMELGTYPYSERYGWLNDKYGVSWQIIALGDTPIEQTIIPALMFVGIVCGKAEEAMNFYASVFKNAKVGKLFRYPAGSEPDKEGTIAHATCTLEAQEFIVMDSAREHSFAFNEAVSFIVHCEDQDEIDYYWEKLSAIPASEQCGWLKDKYGVSWQIVPTAMQEMLNTQDAAAKKRVTEAFLKMKKFDTVALERAFTSHQPE